MTTSTGDEPGPAPGSSANANLISHLGATRTVTKIWVVLGGIVVLVTLIGFFYAVFTLRFPGSSLGNLVYALIWIVVDLLVVERIDGWTKDISAGRYQAVKEPLLVWAILALIFGVVPGILLLIAYIRVLYWSDAPSPASPSARAASTGTPVPSTPSAPAKGPAGFCPRCGASVVGDGRFCARCGSPIPPT